MDYTIMHLTGRSVRVRYNSKHWSKKEALAVKQALSEADGVEKVRVYAANGGVYLEYTDQKQALSALNAVSPETLAKDPYADADYITAEELATRKLHPDVKKDMRNEILVEAAADLFLPAPAQFGFHLYQLAKLKNK